MTRPMHAPDCPSQQPARTEYTADKVIVTFTACTGCAEETDLADDLRAILTKPRAEQLLPPHWTQAMLNALEETE